MEFLVSHVTKITGVKRLRLHTWIERGYIYPSIQKGKGSGSKNVFNTHDIYRIEVFKRLTEKGRGFSREQAAPLADIDFAKVEGFNRYIGKRKPKHEYLVFPRVFIHGKAETSKEPGYLNDHQQLTKYLEDYDDVFLINLRRLKEQVDRKIREVME